jgi:hypothetical protein
VATCGLCLLNPSGARFFSTGVALAGNEAMRQVITDWAHIGWRELWADFPVTAALVAAAIPACLARLAAAARGSLGPAPGVLLLLCLVAAFTALALGDCVRWLPYASSSAAIALALCAADLAPGSIGRGGAGIAAARTAIAGVAILALLAARDDFGRGVGPMPDRFPGGAMAFAREHRLGPRVLNSFHLGGFAIWSGWPRFRVLVDSRNDTVYPPAHVVASVRAQTDRRRFDAVRARYGGDWVLASNLPDHVSFPFLARSRDWMLVYWSEPAVVYVPRSAGRELTQLELAHVDPRAVDASIAAAVRAHRDDPAALSAIEREVLRMRAASPTGIRANVAAAVYYHFRGPGFSAKRDAALELLRRRHGDAPAVRDLLSRFGAGSS